jgi:hypothetical protein
MAGQATHCRAWLLFRSSGLAALGHAARVLAALRAAPRIDARLTINERCVGPSPVGQCLEDLDPRPTAPRGWAGHPGARYFSGGAYAEVVASSGGRREPIEELLRYPVAGELVRFSVELGRALLVVSRREVTVVGNRRRALTAQPVPQDA